MTKILDAAYPPATLPKIGITGVMGYLGGPRATHAWTLSEWLRFHDVKQFPVYVPDMGADPLAQGAEAVQLARALGWSDKMTGAQERAIVIDLETGADRVWYDAIANVVGAHGFVAVAYGSLSTVLGNAAEDLIVADWDNTAVIPVGQIIRGTQYRANVEFGGTTVDYCIFDEWLFGRGGVGPRRKAA